MQRKIKIFSLPWLYENAIISGGALSVSTVKNVTWSKMTMIRPDFFKNLFALPILRIRSPESLVLYVSMFVMGGCGIAYEYTISKIASDLLGNSAQQWAVIIGFMMFFMGVGSDLQKYLSDRNLFDKFIVAEIILGLCGGFGPMVMLFVFGSFPSYYILVQYFFISIIGLLIGFEIPLLTRINQAYTRELKLNLGGVLKMDYIGSLCGALVWVFVLPAWFIMTEMAFVLGVFNVAVAGIALYYFRRLVAAKMAIGLFWLIGFVLLVGGLLQA
ncbi:MAG: hypothetical protein GY868_06100, partial [Deltaproteobacteria bacterium]|nr:hypothetical protein [Deltaproteobacteria bacterium]